MFAGLEISLFVLIHRQMTLELLGAEHARSGRDAVVRVVSRRRSCSGPRPAAGCSAGSATASAGPARSAPRVLCYSLFTLGVLLRARRRNVMLVLRFLACLGIGGVWPNAVALVAEAWPNASRPFLAGLLGAAANVGFVLLGVDRLLLPDHRRTRGAGRSSSARRPRSSACSILALVPESPRWLASRVRRRRDAAGVAAARGAAPPLLSRTILGVMLGAIPVVGSAANANWLVPWTDHAVRAAREGARPSEASRRSRTRGARRRRRSRARAGRSSAACSAGSSRASLGRRLSYFLISLGAFAVSTYIFSQLDPLHPQFQVFAFVLGFVGITYFGWLPLFLPELFPTRVRSTGTGISFNTGRVVAARRRAVGGVPARPVRRRLRARRAAGAGMIYARRDGRDLVRAARRRAASWRTDVERGRRDRSGADGRRARRAVPRAAGCASSGSTCATECRQTARGRSAATGRRRLREVFAASAPCRAEPAEQRRRSRRWSRTRASALRGATVIDTTTGDPDATADLGQRLAATRVRLPRRDADGFERAGAGGRSRRHRGRAGGGVPRQRRAAVPAVREAVVPRRPVGQRGADEARREPRPRAEPGGAGGGAGVRPAVRPRPDGGAGDPPERRGVLAGDGHEGPQDDRRRLHAGGEARRST